VQKVMSASSPKAVTKKEKRGPVSVRTSRDAEYAWSDVRSASGFGDVQKEGGTGKFK
jgi:hypothetical protein